jgi:predicted nucleic acid-binding Zn ribbon protein
MSKMQVEAIFEAVTDSGPSQNPSFPRDTTFCTICQGAIPEGRSKRKSAVCSEKCKDKLDAIRERQRADTKCPMCLHPSTPEERADFRQWRVERKRPLGAYHGGGTKQLEAQSREHAPGLPSRYALQNALRQAVGLLEAERDRILDSECAKGEKGELERNTLPDLARREVEELEGRIEHFKSFLEKPVDTKGTK